MRIFDLDKDVNIDIYAHSLSERRISIQKNKCCMEFNLFGKVAGALMKMRRFREIKILTKILGVQIAKPKKFALL